MKTKIRKIFEKLDELETTITFSIYNVRKRNKHLFRIMFTILDIFVIVAILPYAIADKMTGRDKLRYRR